MSIDSQKIMSESHVDTNWLGHMGEFRPKKRKGLSNVQAALTLTSLVDAFTILVIYLLVATNVGAPDISVDSDIELPKATQATLTPQNITVSFNAGAYKIKGQKVRQGDLVDRLIELKKETEDKDLTIHADKLAQFEDLNPMVLAGLQAGFEKVRFAAIQEPQE